MNFEDELDRSTRSHIKDLIAISNNKDERDQLNLIINNIKPDETKQIITVLEKIYRKCLDEKIKNLIIDKIGVFFINEVEFLIQEFRFELEHN